MIHKLQQIAKCANHVSMKICFIAFVIFISIFMIFYTAGRTLPVWKFKNLRDKYEDKTNTFSTTTKISYSTTRNAQKCIDFFSNMAKNIYGASKNELKQITNLCEKLILTKFQTPKTLDEEYDVYKIT